MITTQDVESFRLLNERVKFILTEIKELRLSVESDDNGYCYWKYIDEVREMANYTDAFSIFCINDDVNLILINESSFEEQQFYHFDFPKEYLFNNNFIELEKEYLSNEMYLAKLELYKYEI